MAPLMYSIMLGGHGEHESSATSRLGESTEHCSPEGEVACTNNTVQQFTQIVLSGVTVVIGDYRNILLIRVNASFVHSGLVFGGG